MLRTLKIQAHLGQLLQLGQVDRVLLLAFAARLWPLVAGPVTVLLIVEHFSPETQGLFYGFSSVLNLQAFFELGASSLIISLAGHHAVEMQQADSLVSQRGKRRLAAIFRGMVLWYSCVGTLFFIAAFSLGWWTFSREQASGPWRLPWTTIVPVAAISMWLTPWIAILEGIGNRDDVYRYRFYQVITGSLVVWVAILSGFGVWSVVAAAAVQLVWLLNLIFYKFADFFRDLRRNACAREPIAWRQEIIPAQWRIGVQSAAHYLATQLLTLFVIATEGLAYGGRFGMTMAVAMSIQGVALAWVQTKFSVMAQLVAKHRRAEAHRLWMTSLLVSTIALVAGFIGFAATIGVLSNSFPKIGLRFIEWVNILILGAGLAANHIIANQAYFVLACRDKPLFGAIISGMIITAITTWIGALAADGRGVVFGYTLGLLLVALPIHSLAFYAYRRSRGHLELSSDITNGSVQG